MGSLQLNVYDDRSILLSDIEVNIPGIHISARHLDYPSNKESPVIFEIEGAIEHIREITIL